MFIPFQLILHELAKSYQAAYSTKQLHALIAKTHLSLDPFYATRITRLYALNHDLSSACKLFDEMPSRRSVFLWNSIIRAHARAHDFRSTFSLFREMVRSDTRPDNFTFACILRACGENCDLQGLAVVHAAALTSGYGMEPICCSTLVGAYSKTGLVNEAERVFGGVVVKDLPMFNSMISGYGYSGYIQKGLRLFNELRSWWRSFDGYTMVALLLCVTEHCLLRVGQGIHSLCLKSGFDHNAHVGSSLVSMYTKLGCLDSAYNVFANLMQPDLVTWSSLITGFSQSGYNRDALFFFRKMNMSGTKCDPLLTASALAASSQLALSGPGCEIHGYILRRGFERDVIVSAAVMDMYFKCGFMDLAMKCFHLFPRRSTVSYNTVILGLGCNGHVSQAFSLFDMLLKEGFEPDPTTLSALLHVCSHAGRVKDGKCYFLRLRDELGIEPGIDHYVHMVRLLGMGGELKEAYDLVMSLSDPVDEGIWGALLACCEAQGDTSMAEAIAYRIFEGNDRPHECSSYRVMLSNVYANNCRWDEAEKLREDTVDIRWRKMPGLSWIA